MIVLDSYTSDWDTGTMVVSCISTACMVTMKNVYQSDTSSFRTLELPKDPHAGMVAAWSDFLNETELPPYAYTIGYVEAPVTRGVMPSHLRVFKQQMIERFDDNIAAMNQAMQNREHDTRYTGWDQVHLDRRLPAGPGRTDRERQDWQEFVRAIVSLLWVRIDQDAAPLYREYLAAKYGGLEALNRSYDTSYAALDEVPFPSACPPRGLPASDWGPSCRDGRIPRAVRLSRRRPQRCISTASISSSARPPGPPPPGAPLRGRKIRTMVVHPSRIWHGSPGSGGGRRLRLGLLSLSRQWPPF